MRGLTRRWVFRDPGTPGRSNSNGAGLYERLLAARGFRDPEVIRRFCDPKLTDLHDPGLLPGTSVATERLVDAVRRGRRIVVYGDYDVDGMTAAAILYHVVKAVAPECDLRIYVPHRLDEGYGLNREALEQIRDQGADLVISVDCGVSAVEPARVAREIGLELIITDHHKIPPESLPEAAAIVHPRLPGSEYPFGELSGAGVAFKLAWGFATRWSGSPRVGKTLQRLLLDLLPLAALGTIADVVPLVDENRTIATYGLKWIKQTPFHGLRALIEAADLMEERIDSEKVGFVLGPRLNACGRMGHAAEAVHLLTAASPDEAVSIAKRLTTLNRTRQQTERAIAEQAAQMAEDLGMTAEDHRAIVLADEGWHGGVLGIACSRLVERFGRPTVLLKRHGEYCRGSARSVEDYSIYEGLTACSHLLSRFGGHDAAAGLMLRTENLEAFTSALVEHANARIAPEKLTPALLIDCDAEIGELDLQTVQRIEAFSPFGRDNPPPALRLEAAAVAEAPRQVGSNGRHLTLNLRSRERRWLRSVWFQAGDRAADLAPGMHVDAVIEPKVNTWQNRSNVEGVIRDLRVVESPTG
jgi:single-stranded-DNA-specific exonuclease